MSNEFQVDSEVDREKKYKNLQNSAGEREREFERAYYDRMAVEIEVDTAKTNW